MSLFAWLITRAMRGPGAYWIAIVAVAHAIVLNGLVGVATGWLYWAHGLALPTLASTA